VTQTIQGAFPTMTDLRFRAEWTEANSRLYLRIRVETDIGLALHAEEIALAWEPLPVQQALARVPVTCYSAAEMLLDMLAGCVGGVFRGMPVPLMARPAVEGCDVH
jgi:hypothetical protein